MTFPKDYLQSWARFFLCARNYAPHCHSACLYNSIMAYGQVNTLTSLLLSFVVFHIYFPRSVNAVVVRMMFEHLLMLSPDRQAFSWSEVKCITIPILFQNICTAQSAGILKIKVSLTSFIFILFFRNLGSALPVKQKIKKTLANDFI